MWSPLQAGKGIYSLPSKDALPDLLLAILRLRLDPLACSLANNLEVAITCSFPHFACSDATICLPCMRVPYPSSQRAVSCTMSHQGKPHLTAWFCRRVRML